MHTLSVSHLCKTYSGQPQPAVDGVSLVLCKGELLGLIGESGSGKTTLLKLLAGLDDPDSGTIRLRGKSVTGPAHNLVPGHPHIRLVHQQFQLSPNVSVTHNIAYMLRGYQAGYRETRLRAMLSLCDLEAVQHHLPRQLSGGEMQRVALARALADEPALLLLDEPFSNADMLRRQHFRHELAEILRRSNTTALLVTHDTTEALALADTIAVMRHGRLVQTAPPQEIYARPVSPYVAGLFGYANSVAVAVLPTLRLRRPPPLAFPASAVLCLRAEHIRLCPEPEADLAGTVRRVQYMGLHILAHIAVGPDAVWQVLLPVGQVPAGRVFMQVAWHQAHVYGA